MFNNIYQLFYLMKIGRDPKQIVEDNLKTFNSEKYRLSLKPRINAKNDETAIFYHGFLPNNEIIRNDNS